MSDMGSSSYRQSYLKNLHKHQLPMREVYREFQNFLNSNYKVSERFPICRTYPYDYLLSVDYICLLA